MVHSQDKSGHLIKNNNHHYLIFGTTYTPEDEQGNVYHIAINLQTLEVEDLQENPNNPCIEDAFIHELDSTRTNNLLKMLELKNWLSKRRLIVITGKARSGKDTLANELSKELTFTKKIALADSVREVVKIVYQKNLINKKDRSKLILIAQGLRKTDPTIWIKTWLRKALKYYDELSFKSTYSLTKSRIIVPDVRQYNELIFFKSLNATTIKVTSDEKQRWERVIESEGYETAIQNKHLSEELEKNIEKFETDFHIHNEYTNKFFEDIRNIISILEQEAK